VKHYKTAYVQSVWAWHFQYVISQIMFDEKQSYWCLGRWKMKHCVLKLFNGGTPHIEALVPASNRHFIIIKAGTDLKKCNRLISKS